MYHVSWYLENGSGFNCVIIDWIYFLCYCEQDADYFWTDHYKIHFEIFKNEAIIVINTWYDSHVIFCYRDREISSQFHNLCMMKIQKMFRNNWKFLADVKSWKHFWNLIYLSNCLQTFSLNMQRVRMSGVSCTKSGKRSV